jgi:hypothetical protein
MSVEKKFSGMQSLGKENCMPVHHNVFCRKSKVVPSEHYLRISAWNCLQTCLRKASFTLYVDNH